MLIEIPNIKIMLQNANSDIIKSIFGLKVKNTSLLVFTFHTVIFSIILTLPRTN